MTEREYTWYLEPKTKAVNEAIAAELAANGAIDSSPRKVICADGKRHNLWECNIEIVTIFNLNYRLGREINIFRREGQGKRQNVNFLFRRRARLPKNGSHTISTVI